jgi:gliding motility-associated-like protein
VAYTVTSVTLTAVTQDPTASITVNGTAVASGTASGAIALAVGPNTITTLVTAQDGLTTKSYIITVIRTAPSTNALLSSITASPATLQTTASGPGYANYTATVAYTVTSATLTAVTQDPTATISVNGTPIASGTTTGAISLAVGPNTITTLVTAQDGITTKSYVVTIIRAAASTNALLNAITISPYAVKTTVSGPGYANYTAPVANTVTSVTITALAADPTATITINGVSVTSGTASGSIPLAIGQNTITAIVTAQDGITTKSYIITITRAPSSNAVLNAISLSPATAKTTVSGPGYANYAATVANTVSSVTITPVTQDPTATVTVNGAAVTSGTASAAIPLIIGQNTITTIVTAQDGVTTKSYIFTVTRSPSSNALLTSISISPATAKTTVSGPGYANYTATVASTLTSVTVTPVTQDPTATATVNGTAVTSGTASAAIPLAAGQNTVTTIVTAQDGVTTRSYIITITRPVASMNSVYEPIGVAAPPDSPQLAEDGLVVHQAVSPNGDGVNDFLNIEGISNYPDNKLKIMNRNGTLVYEADGYDNRSKTFDGHSNKTGVMQLPGTYFYSLDYTVDGKPKHKTGFIVLKY